MKKTAIKFQAKTATGTNQKHTFYGGDANTEDEFAEFFAEDSKMTAGSSFQPNHAPMAASNLKSP